MRAIRSAKFAEYTSTYAILHNIGVHDTTLIEKRDASVGVGVYVRDACDEGTTLFVVPAHRVFANSVVSRIGAPVSLNEKAPAALAGLDDGLITFLTGAPDARGWAELSWRLALERHRSLSPWWGWLEGLPGVEETAALMAGAQAQCRAHHPPLVPFLTQARKRLAEEKRRAHATLAASNLSPAFPVFSWAVDTLISRGVLLPRCWTTAGAETDQEATAAAATEVGIVPYVDLINGPDDIGRSANATIEIASESDDLPEWYLRWIVQDAQLKSRDGVTELSRILEQRYCVCVSLTKPLRASEEVILPYTFDAMSTNALSEGQETLLTRLLKFHY